MPPNGAKVGIHARALRPPQWVDRLGRRPLISGVGVLRPWRGRRLGRGDIAGHPPVSTAYVLGGLSRRQNRVVICLAEGARPLPRFVWATLFVCVWSFSKHGGEWPTSPTVRAPHDWLGCGRVPLPTSNVVDCFLRLNWPALTRAVRVMGGAAAGGGGGGGRARQRAEPRSCSKRVLQTRAATMSFEKPRL